MGLRHNFRASWDSMNYFPQYWALRSAAATNTAAQRYIGYDPTTGTPVGAKFNGADCATPLRKGTLRPRYIDCPGGAVSMDEFQGGIREFQYSSIMDYGAEFNSDLMGLGMYDKAAMKFSYAGDGYVEVFTDSKTDTLSKQNWASLHAFQNAFGFPSPISLFGSGSINYTSYPNLFNSGAASIGMRKDVPYASISGTDVCDSSGKCYFQSDPDNNPLVPYFFCSDEFVGNLTCARFDSGADAYEQVHDIISRYENFYLLNNFKRDRYTFHTSLGYKDRVASRYLDLIRNQLTWYALLRADFEDFMGETGNNQFFADEDGWGSFSVGVSDGFDLFGRVIAKPEAGNFTMVAANASTDYPIAYLKKSSDLTSAPGAGETTIGLIDGKYIDTTWDFDNCGYYWADECQTRIGYFIDKTVALDVLSQSQAYFTGRDTSTDVRKYAIGYILPYKKQIQEKLGALLAGDYNSLAARVDNTNPAALKVTLPTWSINNPAGGFTLQLYAGVYGLSSFPTTFDHDFIDTTRIFVVGNGEAPVPDSQITCSVAPGTTANGYFCITDASSGKSYAAKTYPTVTDTAGGPAYRQDTGVRMLQTYASVLAAAVAECAAAAPNNCTAKTLAATQFKENLDVMRSLHNAYGYANYKTDAPFIY